MKDSVEVALELNEKEVYSHIAHESAEDIIRIISSLDAERAKNKGEIIYYQDDWDDLIRQRIQKGKRHTAFDFYNPALLDIWESRVNRMKEIRNKIKITTIAILSFAGITAILSIIYREALLLVGLSMLPLLIFLREYKKEFLDFGYYQLTQFFIDELKELIANHPLDKEKYGFKVFNYDYFGIDIKKRGINTIATVKEEDVAENK
ncbi:hypothetical protein PAP_00735 [Palaeococcus pacificus DY20341]|uniref:Uncharacterized protein n=1 Tax=Palaeococcus pacificus DY20341 TaxID=1343739 RepID=A0A075LPK5_9EURY|nr:hypothetical protein [Palaeococcus pacificus]AIF68590.1 hypothetical protein PAP_00735 [Palaeococcus pacificus DY20341]